MSVFKQHDPEPLVAAITALPPNNEYESEALRAIRQTARECWKEDWDDSKAHHELSRLLELRLIEVRPDRIATNTLETGHVGPPIKGLYARIPENER